MAFRILDASAFYAGVPFGSPETYHTTQKILGEVRHIKRSHDALGALIRTGRLVVRDPGEAAAGRVRRQAEGSGDMPELSAGDLSVLALCLEMRGEIITDDYAVANVASGLGLPVIPVMTGGIRRAGRWVRYCSGCKIETGTAVCPRCGNPSRKRLARA